MSSLREIGALAALATRGTHSMQCIQAANVASQFFCSVNLRALATVSSDAAHSASTSAQESALGWIGREVKPKGKKDPPLSWIYMREGTDGVKRLMPWSERLIWGTVLGGIAYLVVPRIHNARKKAAEESEAAKLREAELHQKRLIAARLLLSGKTWVHDEAEAFEGMTPKQIVDFLKQNSINPEDPFEGMSPDEIDEFVRQTGVSL